MTQKERIDRVEQMIKTLAETLNRVTSSIKTGSDEYNLYAVRSALSEQEEFDFETYVKTQNKDSNEEG